jgi:TfoX/Sxy family transcriptional regulator of competence genes
MARPPKSAQAPAEDPRLAALARTFLTDKRVSYGKLFSAMGLKVDGKIFAMVVKGRLVVKLPRQRVDELVDSGAAERFDPGHGRLMKEWASLLGKKPSWDSLAREAFSYVGRR